VLPLHLNVLVGLLLLPHVAVAFQRVAKRLQFIGLALAQELLDYL